MDQLGGCTVLGELGKGAMGTVYKAERAGVVVALKVLAEEWAKDQTLTDHFVQAVVDSALAGLVAASTNPHARGASA